MVYNTEALRRALKLALLIIVGEFPKDDDRHVLARRTAAEFDIDLGDE